MYSYSGNDSSGDNEGCMLALVGILFAVLAALCASGKIVLFVR